jgi:hypothetical protein
MMAGLFLANVWCNYWLIALFLGIVTFVSWLNWGHGNSSKRTCAWLGYAAAAPAISLLVAAHAVGYGARSHLHLGGLLIFDPKVILLIDCGPFAMYYFPKVAHEMVKRDWLWVSLAALPLSIFGSRALFAYSYELYRGVLIEIPGSRDYSHMGIFITLAIMTVLYLKLGRRVYKVGLLTTGGHSPGDSCFDQFAGGLPVAQYLDDIPGLRSPVRDSGIVEGGN